MNPDDVLFQQLNLPPLGLLPDLTRAFQDSTGWFWDEYRKVRMLPLFTPGGRTTKSGSQNTQSNELAWTKYTPYPVREYFDEHIFSWMSPKGRIILLQTPATNSLDIHIDCSERAFNTRQHKMRVVVSGNSHDLYYLSGDDHERVYAPRVDNGVPFVIDGSWPHGMDNTHQGDKVTICLGAPWNGDDDVSYLSLLGRSYNDDAGLLKSDLVLPSDYHRFFEDPTERKKKFDETG